jgi:hypothetical protein
MDREPTIRLITDWPRIRQLVAKKLGKTEDEVQAMADGKDSLDQVELTMAVEGSACRLAQIVAAKLTLPGCLSRMGRLSGSAILR